MQTQYPFLLFSAFVSVFYASDVWAATCTATPECASLGYKYSQEDCPRGGLKCPTGDGYYCPTPRPKCNIGDIFYTDNTCVAASNHDNSKTVLGIVVYLNDDGVGGQIMAPWPIDSNGNKSSSNVAMYWSPQIKDIQELSNYTSSSTASTDDDSCGNTDKIVAQGNASTYPAAWATRKYAPTVETAGKWCLPAAGVMADIYNNRTAIQDAIKNVGGVEYPNCCTWSSSEISEHFTWTSSLVSDYGLSGSNKSSTLNYYVLPVLEF